MKVGDRVSYAADPLLYGLMEVSRIRRDGRLECRSAAKALGWPKNLIEIFTVTELELSAKDPPLDPMPKPNPKPPTNIRWPKG